MKKFLALVPLFVVCVIYSSVSYAASIGNKIEPIGNMNVAVTAEGNFIFDRDMESGGSSTSGSQITSFKIEDMNQEYAKLMLGVTDYANIFAKLGVSQIRDARFKFSSGEDVKAKFEHDFIYGGGLNVVYKFGPQEVYLIGLNGDFSFYEADTKNLDITGSNATNISGKVKIREWQVGGYAGRKFDINDNISALPYLGVFYNKFNTKTGGIKYTISGTQFTLTFDSDAEDEVGVATGIDVDLFKNFTLNIEGRFIAGNAVSVGGTFNF